MIPYQNYIVISGFLFYLSSKIASFFCERYNMYRRGNLSSIPELDTEEDGERKWVPKKKHEVLKAKYKCLKKLFQIYDASVIGTNEAMSGDNNSEFENSSVATTIIRELTVDQSCISTQMDAKIDKFAETIDAYTSEKNLDCYCQNYNTQSCQSHNCENCQSSCQKERLFREHQLIQSLQSHPSYMGYERRKLTRFQCFVQRIFGIRKEAYKPQEKMYAASDPVLTFKEKRRRRGLRFRRIKRAKKVRSDSALRDAKSPTILSYVQSVQRQCLMDTTPRKCPIVGCNMISYGIINYNDHLNLCHFKERKFVCHYCHEGFETEYDKLVHENEHIGISKLGTNMSTLSTVGQGHKIASITQTEPEVNIPEDKLKKIVSFFDKMSSPGQILTEINKSQSSVTNLTSKDTGSSSDTGSATQRSDSEQTRSSSCNLRRQPDKTVSFGGSDRARPAPPCTCRYCGENFSCRRQLSLHINSEHRTRDPFTKYHSCAGIVRPRSTTTEEGSINVKTATNSVSYGGSVKRVDTSTTIQSVQASSGHKSDESITCDPSTNIIYYTSVESLANKPSASLVDSLVDKVRSYRWEPGTKIIRV